MDPADDKRTDEEKARDLDGLEQSLQETVDLVHSDEQAVSQFVEPPNLVPQGSVLSGEPPSIPETAQPYVPVSDTELPTTTENPDLRPEQPVTSTQASPPASQALAGAMGPQAVPPLRRAPMPPMRELFSPRSMVPQLPVRNPTIKPPFAVGMEPGLPSTTSEVPEMGTAQPLVASGGPDISLAEGAPGPDIDAFIRDQHARWQASRAPVSPPSFDQRQDSGMQEPYNMRSDLEQFTSQVSESYESVHQALSILTDIVGSHGRSVIDVNARLMRWGIL